jgi:hypothetical protein
MKSFNLYKFICQIRNEDFQLQCNEKNQIDIAVANNALTKVLKQSSWMLIHGQKEYLLLNEYPGDYIINNFKKEWNYLAAKTRPDGDGKQPWSKIGLTALQFLAWYGRLDVQEKYPYPISTLEFKDWFWKHGISELNLYRNLGPEEYAEVQLSPPKIKRDELDLPIEIFRPGFKKQKKSGKSFKAGVEEYVFGVNIIGYAYAEIGIGEDLRMLAKSLSHAKIPFKVIDFDPGKFVAQRKRNFGKTWNESKSKKFDINIFCLTAEETGRYFIKHGGVSMMRQYNIGYWPWELAKWPKKMAGLLNIVDEIWASSLHTYNSIPKYNSLQLFHMPLPVEVDNKKINDKEFVRKRFNLPPSGFIFYFAFDLNSYVDRKNPGACFDAFQKAFPAEEKSTVEVYLLIKIHGPKKFLNHPALINLFNSNDKRIFILYETLNRDDLTSLYSCCDCLVSLHRAEGYGRAIAEAILLGQHVITTGYSGNLDFCLDGNVDLVSYILKKIKRGQYPHHHNQSWAEPNIDDAAKLMKKFCFEKKQSERKRVRLDLSPKTLAQQYQKRLIAIYDQF